MQISNRVTQQTKLNNSQPDVSNDDFQKLLDAEKAKIPQVGDIIKGTVLSASKAEVKLDIDGIATGVVRGRELYFEAEEYANLKPGDVIEATIVEEENENGDLELSFRSAGQQKAWNALFDAYENRTILKFRVNDANKGGLIVSYGQIQGFLPVSQLAPENYPRVNGGDKSRILDKLKSFVGTDFEVKIMTLDEKDDKLIVSEKEAWQEKQKDIISQYKVGSVVEGVITALTNFGVFVSFGENLEGLIHISEIAWQRIDDPSDLFKIRDKIKAEIISIEGSKIFLSTKKLLTDPWYDVEKKYKIGQVVSGTILKVNLFGLFVELDHDIHGLAHISQIGLAPEQNISEVFHAGEKRDFIIVSIEPKDHRLGLSVLIKAKQPTAQPTAKSKKKQDLSASSGQADGEKDGEKAVKTKKVKKEKINQAEEKKIKNISATAL
ncbi:S1 RNA-binding domain-containing protein [Patescibacteria group bacterium]|nr:S1 RNA-binding domain-containing protein [Patescibacteria group bacterium]MBU1663229.1 S1 RNA-binding domain-containing protein [Patescibacteria group bacterium]MBU1934368.1 S1 RNA-binding domain-containing protein [Patescibacteria group bacterium]MBU2233891.1 S1 RNA-binding domain-containing protein [Patescibacteria group bacterium]MBU2263830.1 S1 RNA-binding domain-containing protein [Patescibacteria group bacterium]